MFVCTLVINLFAILFCLVLLFKDVDTHCRLNHAYHLSLATPYLQTKEARLAELQASVPRVTAEITSLRVQMARLR
jgi:hypothetical protein